MNSLHWNSETGYESNCILCKEEIIQDLRERTNMKDVEGILLLMDIIEKTPISVPEFYIEKAQEILGSVIIIK